MNLKIKAVLKKKGAKGKEKLMEEEGIEGLKKIDDFLRN